MNDVRKLDLNLVVALNALLTEPNSSRSARKAGVSHATFTAALARLRSIFDDPLVEVEAREYRLTSRAMALQPQVADCMANLERVFNVLPDFDPETSTRRFLITASDYVASEIARPLLTVVRRTAPHTHVTFEGLPVEQGVSPEYLLQRDLVISGSGRGVPGKRSALFTDRFVCLVDQDNPLLDQGRLSVEALAELPLVRPTFGPHISTPVDDVLKEHAITPPTAMTVQDFLKVPLALSGTRWCGWVPQRAAQRFARALGLLVADTEIRPEVLVEAAFWHPAKTKDPARIWLLQQVREAARIVEFGESDFSSPLADRDH